MLLPYVRSDNPVPATCHLGCDYVGVGILLLMGTIRSLSIGTVAAVMSKKPNRLVGLLTQEHFSYSLYLWP